MKRFNAFASTLRIKTLLCCGAAVLLTACGGNVDGGSGQLSASAASVVTDAGAASTASTAAPAPAVDTIAEAAPAVNNEAAAPASTEPAPTPGSADATAQAADPNAHAFELSGYDSTAPQTQAGLQDASASALASTPQ
ncbi:hypothetical protein [Massilia sp. IC2-476]|uniref:hypothetical protein n=1 Tax=Massilia sp. IC2-476 TaxID=2887199 RepID=UPI001D112484|nr:hypothetical protein [Massilia sp. IC2-476]MCC2972595.1 hypothetical protein [Massilia sp. IC2-476]